MLRYLSIIYLNFTIFTVFLKNILRKKCLVFTRISHFSSTFVYNTIIKVQEDIQMSLLGKVIKVGIAAGALYTAKKVSDKYNENNPNGVEDKEAKINAYKDAAGEVRAEYAEVIREKAPGLKDKINGGIQSAADFAAEKIPGAAEKLQNAVDSAANYISQKAPEAASKLEEVIDTVTEKVTEFVDGEVQETVDADFESVVAESEEAAPAEEEKTEE